MAGRDAGIASTIAGPQGFQGFKGFRFRDFENRAKQIKECVPCVRTLEDASSMAQCYLRNLSLFTGTAIPKQQKQKPIYTRGEHDSSSAGPASFEITCRATAWI